MKKNLFRLVFMFTIAVSFIGCTYLPLNPNQYPSVTTDPVNNLSMDSAMIRGNVYKDGGATITSRGFCWGTTLNPTIDNSTTIFEGNGIGYFTSTINNLSINTTYYVRAWAINSVGLSYGNQISFSSSYSIGQNFGGGIIFYIDATEVHGLIAATSDQSTSIQWYNGNYISTGATGTTIGTGKSNTNAIVASQGTGSYAASICKNYSGGGYNDWYLPSLNELNQMYQQDTILGISIYNTYWSSSESDINDAYDVIFYYNYPYSNIDDKSDLNSVRAIRAF